MHIEALAMKGAELNQKRPGDPSDAIRAHVICARERQARQFHSLPNDYVGEKGLADFARSQVSHKFNLTICE